MTRVWIPHPHQLPMVEHLAGKPRRAVYSGCGSGKTVVVATHLAETLHDRFSIDRWLIVAPDSVAEDTWQREFAKWEHLAYLQPRLIGFSELGMRRAVKDGRPAGLEFSDRAAVKRLIRGDQSPVHICSYTVWPWLVRATGVNFPYRGVVLDESGFLRSKDSERWKAANHAVNKLGLVQEVIELDGTPLPSRYENLHAPFLLMDKGERLGVTKTDFRDRWCEPDARGYGGKVFSWRVRKDKIAAIQAKIAELAVSTDRDIGVALVESEQEVRLPAAARKVYDQMEHDMMVQLASGAIVAANAAVAANKLLQICNGFIYDNERTVRVLHAAKLDAIVEAIEALDRPVLLPYLFLPDGAALAKRLGKRLRFANDVGAKDQFRAGDLPVLAFHPGSMAHGIDGLQGASNTVLWFGATHRYDWHHQIYKRLHREGQRADTVFVRRFIAAGTVEERIIREVLANRGEQNAGLLKALKK